MSENKKKPFILRISPDILKAVEQWAADDFRSVNGQIEFILNDALKKSGRTTQPKSKPENKND
ncbi:MAG: Arc family DNA-binding protein [Fimbriimonadaceae bacterium]|nr:Arc family DNA-binding protein [Chitinophagales bacterium]